VNTSLAVPELTDNQRRELTDVRSPYSAEDRVAVAVAYLISGGNSVEAAKKASPLLSTPIEAGTIRQWKSRAGWFPQAESIARGILQQELDRKYTQLLHKTEAEMMDRIKDGEHKVVNGEILRVPVGLKDLVVTHGVISDKRAMIRGEPTSRREDSGVELIFKLAEALQEKGQVAREVIEGDFEEVTDGNS
jgi:hypothetical protein